MKLKEKNRDFHIDREEYALLFYDMDPEVRETFCRVLENSERKGITQKMVSDTAISLRY